MLRRRGTTLRAAAAIGLALAVVVGGLVAMAFAAPTGTERMQMIKCSSPALGGRLPAEVYLPAGYSTSDLRYPVVYFLHGLPAGPGDYENAGFIADGVEASWRSAIVVAPQGARSDGDDPEYLDHGIRENWPQAITHDLTRCIDSHFRTIANRTGRALVGLSAGGFGAFNIGLRHFDTYAAVESWSGYFAATDPSGWHVLDLGSAQANAAARIPPDGATRAQLRRDPTFIGFYVGRQDDRFYSWNVNLHRRFRADGILHRFAVYPGGHTQSLWVRYGPIWLGLALTHLAPAR